ncbi:GIN domain-containing protein [Blastomonas sp.]|uniref:GIN domain-containing protein n=1 Tax=Blastomonas sp. TaxID=1909299 RepID=UPI0035939BBE
MMRWLLLVLAILGCADVAHAAERRFTLGAFDRVRVEGDVSVEIRSDTAPFAFATGDPRALEALTIRVQGDTVYVRRARRNAPAEARNLPSEPAPELHVVLNARAISAVAVLGNGNLRIDQLRGDKASATLDGTGLVEIDRIASPAATLSLNGSGRMVVAGKAQTGRVTMLGDGTIEGAGLAMTSLDFTGEGPVTARVSIDGPVRIAVKGGATLTIGGNPVCTVRQIGDNSITCGAGGHDGSGLAR